MASFGASNVALLTNSSASSSRRETTRAAINLPRLRRNSLSLPKLTGTRNLVEELQLKNGCTQIEKISNSPITNITEASPDQRVMEKLYLIMEAIADRVEMHQNLCEQRNNWNSLLLTSINAISLTAATMAGVAATAPAPPVALKLSSTLLYLAAAGMLVIMNKIQPSQLAEEQRNAARLFKQLHQEIQTLVSIGSPTTKDVKEAMEKVLALDKAYPLPLVGVMLEKFPAKVEPAVWWPRRGSRPPKGISGNGWDVKLEEEMRKVVKVLRRKDKEDYLRLGEKALKLNKALAVAGPLFAGLGALGSAFLGSSGHSSWAVVLGVVGGALSSIVNTIEHGGQVGMVFEMYRSNAGFFKLMEESIESNLERTVERREDGELFELKVALQLGRSLEELRDLAASSSIKGEAHQEFASKLF